MKVALSVLGTFHMFDLARELYARDALAGIFTGYPRFKLRNEGLPPELIHTFPLIHGAFLAFPWKAQVGRYWTRQAERFDTATFAAHVARRLPPCDVYVGLSGSSLPAGRLAQQRGARYISDRGSSHIRTQDRLLREEAELWGLPAIGNDPHGIEMEEAEYAAADRITVPSGFVYRTFIEQGVPAAKLRTLPYGVNLSRFEPDGAPAAGRFDVLFVGGMSLRKGVPYLVQAFNKVAHPAKSLTFVGSVSNEIVEMLKQRKLWPQNARAIGPVPQTKLKPLMSRSHVMALPSVEEGLALVQAQAMACGCPVIATPNTGAEEIITDGVEGFIVPVRDADALAARLQQLADNPDQRVAMGRSALERTKSLGGWRSYGDQAMAIYQDAVANKG